VEAERRQVTVLFADMVGFTGLSERSGEQAAYTLMRGLSKLMERQCVSRAVTFEALQVAASWACSARRLRLRTHRSGRVVRRLNPSTAQGSRV
jgi:Adenylate and Guanylate cyclase catalytic domain